MNNNLFNKCLTYDLEKLFKKKGYLFFTKGNYNLNIIGVRSNQGRKVTNKFDDVLIVDYNTPTGHRRDIYSITTDPGLYYMKNPINKIGTGILVPNQYKSTYALDYHNGKYLALCQRLKPVEVYRDNNKDDVYDLYPEKIERGMFGVNIHKSGTDSTQIDKWSAACQVFANEKYFNEFIATCKKARDTYGNSFTYTLITEEDMI